ncbi:MAG: hypothetical protein AAB649_07625 [Patescibacteria group bacterium]
MIKQIRNTPLKNQKSTQEMDIDDNDNLAGFFELLLKVDRRVNPHIYDQAKRYD